MSDTATVEAEAPVAADVVTLSQDQLKQMLSAAADQAIAKYAQAASISNEAPKSMKAKVSDGFIKDERGREGEILKTYRVDGVHATKIAEIDMAKLRMYEEMARENPQDMPVDRQNFAFSPKTLAAKKLKFINVIGGKVHARSQNQIEQLEWLKTQKIENGGLPGLYEVTEDASTWLCNVCKPSRAFGNKTDWEAHREATHGIAREQAA